EVSASRGPRCQRSSTRGWVLTDAPMHTITEALVATGVAGRAHHESYHRLFSHGTWDPDVVGYWVVQRLLKLAGPDALRIVIDDTVAPKKGPHVLGSAATSTPPRWAW